ncbi:alpha/beta fold hydrolase [Spirillospora sp. NPDC050679]
MTDSSCGPLPYTRTGHGPALLLAHGAGSDIDDSFGPLLDGLARDRTVIAPHYPGSGPVPRSAAPLDPDALADRLAVTAADAGFDAFAVLGFSTGAPLAVRTAVRHPGRVTALVLSAGFARANARLRAALETWRALGALRERRTLARYLALQVFSARWLDERTPREVEELLDGIAAGLPPGADDQLDLAMRIDVRADLPAVTAPTLVVSATGDHLTSPWHGRELAEGIPRARLAELDCGHAIAAERPADWLAVIRDFL